MVFMAMGGGTNVEEALGGRMVGRRMVGRLDGCVNDGAAAGRGTSNGTLRWTGGGPVNLALK